MNFPPMIWLGLLYHTGKFAFFVSSIFPMRTYLAVNDQVQLVVKSRKSLITHFLHPPDENREDFLRPSLMERLDVLRLDVEFDQFVPRSKQSPRS